MFCPSCSYHLQKLEVTTNSGGKFSVDHCGRCGGTWFDPYEVNRIPYHEVVRMAHLSVLPQAPLTSFTSHKCPSCHKELHSFHSDSLPKGVRFLRCNKCHGIWATQKALEEFKKQQEETIQEYKTGATAFPSLSVVFVPALMVLLLLLTTLMTVFSLAETKESRIKAESSITNLQTFPISPASVIITFQTTTPVKSKITYGLSVLEMTSKDINIHPNTKHNIILSHLKPTTFYIFKITLIDDQGRAYTTSENSFLTGL